MLTVSDIKQFVYCPRILYYRHVLPMPYVPTPKMIAGRTIHSQMSKREHRRTTKRYQLAAGNRLFNQSFVSERLGLIGKLDMLIEDGGNYYPVEYKYSYGEPQLHHRYQLFAYALLVEENLQSVIRRGYVYMLASESVFQIDISESQKLFTKKVITRMNRIISLQEMPAPTPHRERCPNCEFRLYCGDV